MTGPEPADLAAIHQAFLLRDGAAAVRALLSLLAERTGGAAILLGPSGTPDMTVPPNANGHGEASAEIRRVTSGLASSASVSRRDWHARIAGARPGCAVMVTSPAPISPYLSTLISHAAAFIGIRQLADDQQIAVARAREAFMRMLLDPQRTAREARRMIADTEPVIAGSIRVFLAEDPGRNRRDTDAACQAACGPIAWVMPCPAHPGHSMALVPAPGAEPATRTLTALRRECGPAAVIGVSAPVDLRDGAYGWQQAHHALAAARNLPGRAAEYDGVGDLARVLGPGAFAWARHVLSPLTGWEPVRKDQPDSKELTVMLRAWLELGASAGGSHLDLHPNTVRKWAGFSFRLLGRDIRALPDLAELHLALQLHPPPGTDPSAIREEPPPRLSEILRQESARRWARFALGPLCKPSSGRGPGEERALSGPLLDAVRCRLEPGATASSAAAALGITPRSLTRRLARAGEKTQRCLTRIGPDMYDLYLALSILGLLPGV